MTTGERRILGRAISINEAAVRKLFKSLSDVARRKDIASGQELANGMEIL